MLTERQIEDMIFDAFRQTNCRVGHIVMMRTFRFGIEMRLNPIEKDKYFSVMSGIINLGYVTYHADSPECLRLTEKGYNYIYDEAKVKDMMNMPWFIPELNNTNWEKAFNNFYHHTIGNKYNPYKLHWEQFFEWIDAYNPGRPLPAEEKNAIMISPEGQKDRAYALVSGLPNDNARFSFYLTAQNFCEKTVLNK